MRLPWNQPVLTEIDMNAEIGGYQADFVKPAWRPRHAWIVAALLLLAPSASRAEEERTRPPVSAKNAADAGAFSTFGAMAPRSDTHQALVQTIGGYDIPRRAALFQSLLEVRVIGPVSLRGGVSYEERGQMQPMFGARLDVLRQEKHVVDLAVASGYEAIGFNTVPALASTVAIGRSAGKLRFVTNIGCGYGFEKGESYGDFRAAAFYRVGEHIRLGLESKLAVDLERDNNEPTDEPDWQGAVGPTTTLMLGHFVLGGGVAMSAARLRQSAATRVGPVARVEVGMVF